MRIARHLLLVGFTLAVSALAVRSASADEVTYEIKKSSNPATAGTPGTVSVTVVGKNGWHVNGEAPITAVVKADPGVELPKPKLTRADLAQSTKESARFDIPFSCAEAGKKAITAQTRFVMCQEQACKPVSETVAFEVNVQATAPVTAPAPKGKGQPKAGAAKGATKTVKPAAPPAT